MGQGQGNRMVYECFSDVVIDSYERDWFVRKKHHPFLYSVFVRDIFVLRLEGDVIWLYLSPEQGKPMCGSQTCCISVQSAYRNFKYDIDQLILLAPGWLAFVTFYSLACTIYRILFCLQIIQTSKYRTVAFFFSIPKCKMTLSQHDIGYFPVRRVCMISAVLVQNGSAIFDHLL